MLPPVEEEIPLTREWAVELLPYSVRVNAIMVAESYTPLYKKMDQHLPNPQEKLKQIESKIPLEKRMTTPEEIANTVAFLLSENPAIPLANCYMSMVAMFIWTDH